MRATDGESTHYDEVRPVSSLSQNRVMRIRTKIVVMFIAPGLDQEPRDPAECQVGLVYAVHMGTAPARSCNNCYQRPSVKISTQPPEHD